MSCHKVNTRTQNAFSNSRGTFQNFLNQSEIWGRRGCDNAFEIQFFFFRNNRLGATPGLGSRPSLFTAGVGSFVAQNHMHSGGEKFVIDEGRVLFVLLARIFRTFRRFCSVLR
jgi:hypothetical protein